MIDNMSKNSSGAFLAVIIVVAILVTGWVAVHIPPKQATSLGSTVGGNDYQATSTGFGAIYGAQSFNLLAVGSQVIKGGYGSFGSVIITGANTGVFNIYNATTTDINKRVQTKASSTILLASFPASATAGTYIFDEVFTDGLLIDLISGQIPTTTITYRQ